MLDLLCRLDTNDDPDDGGEGTSGRRCVMSTSLCRMSVRLRKQRGLTTRNRAAKARCDCAPGWGEVGKRGGDGTTRKRTRREPFQGKSNPWMQWARGIVSTQALRIFARRRLTGWSRGWQSRWGSLHHAVGRNRGFSRRRLQPEILCRT